MEITPQSPSPNLPASEVTQTPTAPPVHEQNKSRFNWKTFAILLASVLIVIGVASQAVVFLGMKSSLQTLKKAQEKQPKITTFPSPTPYKLKIYSNPSFSIEYPTGWTAETKNDTTTFSSPPVKVCPTCDLHSESQITASVLDNSSSLPLTTFISNYEAANQLMDPTELDTTYIKVLTDNGISANTVGALHMPGGCGEEFIFVNAGNKIILLNFICTSDTLPSQVLSTFKLTNASPTNLKTISSVKSPNGEKELLIQTDSNDKRNLVIHDVKTNTDMVLLSRIIADADTWFAPTSNNWSPGNDYVYLWVGLPDGGDLYIFKSTGEKFANGKNYLLASELGYNQMPIGEPTWTSSTLLTFTGGVSLVIKPKTYYNYTFDVKKETLTKNP